MAEYEVTDRTRVRREVERARYDEAVAIYRARVQAGRIELANPLAGALSCRGTALRSLGRLAEAVADHDEAIGIRRALVQAGRTDLANGLADALDNRAAAVADLGRLAEAVALYDEAIDIRRSLVQAGRHVSFTELNSPHGHDAFLVDSELPMLARLVGPFLDRCYHDLPKA